MASTLIAGNATNSGVSLTGAVDGILEIKTGSGAGTTAVTVSTGQVVTLANALPIASGGTGGTTAVTAFDALSPATTKGDLIVSNGTDNVRQAIGTDTHVLTADSTTATGVKWAAAGGGGGGGFSNIQVFTSNGTFTVPTGITKVKVTVVGGGAGGSYGSAIGCGVTGGPGGSAGGAAIEIISGLTPGGTVSVTVGAGGAGGNGNIPTNPTVGGTSSFGAYCSATGGAINAGAGGLGSGGDLNIRGGAGAVNAAYAMGAFIAGTAAFNGGVGGSSILGGGGSAGVSAGSAGAGGAYGGGGGGAENLGGAGAAGVVIVEY